MDSTKRGNRAWPTAAMLILSLLLHAALLLLPLPPLHQASSPSDSPTMVVELTHRPLEPESPEPVPEPIRPLPDRSERPDDGPAPSLSVQPSEAQSSPTELPTQSTSSHATAPADRIQAQLLEAARVLGRESEQVEETEGLQYDAAPALPSRPGWLNQYTGRVMPSLDRWKGNDGSRSARVVTAGGRVFCIRTRAATIAETFNPWMSSAVPMMHECGRERPNRADQANPWVRRPSAGGE